MHKMCFIPLRHLESVAQPLLLEIDKFKTTQGGMPLLKLLIVLTYLHSAQFLLQDDVSDLMWSNHKSM